jgi:hypothetical protein
MTRLRRPEDSYSATFCSMPEPASGRAPHKPVLIGFLNDLLELDDAHRIESVSLLPPEQRPKVSELKYSIVDVK